MKRRNFLKSTGKVAVAAPFILNGINVQSFAQSPIFRNSSENDNILILIRLNGGNDGLNTLIPLDQYDSLANLRGNILVPQTSIIQLENDNGFHPAMGAMANMYQDGKINIVQNVGYENQNRSHFRSTDIWINGINSEDTISTGWLGRWMDSVYTGYPEDYPNLETPDPIAISMRKKVTMTCQGVNVNYSMSVNDPLDLQLLNIVNEGVIPDSIYGQELSFLRGAVEQTNNYTDSLTALANSGENIGDYPNTDIAQQLKNVALLISGGCKTKVYVAEIGGFDTHGNQVDFEDTTQGTHAELLNELSNAIAAFQNDITSQGFSEKVLGMTFSEFGRRIRSNASFGTDHGTAAPLIIFGDCVNPIIYGDNPVMSDEIDDRAGVPMQFDFKSVYGSVLMDWFDVPQEDVLTLLTEDFEYIPVIQGCGSVNTDEVFFEDINMKVGPNPFVESFVVSFELAKPEDIRIEFLDVTGRRVGVLQEEVNVKNIYSKVFNFSQLASGAYLVHLRIGDKSKVVKIIKS